MPTSVRRLPRIVFLLLFILSTFSCVEETNKPPDPAEGYYPEVQCPFGHPVFTCHVAPCTAPIVVVRPQYELGYSSDKGTPLWVCETVDKEELEGNAKRSPGFVLDPLIPRSYQTSPWVYKNSGFHRGHLAAAANQKWNQFFMNQTFYISNAAPMYPRFNGTSGVWYRLEQWVRDLAKQRDTRLYVISGPSFHVKQVPISKGPDRRGDLQEVHIPSHFYKIVAAPLKHGKWAVVAFLVENKNVMDRRPLHVHIKSVDYIEELTGLNFLPSLSLVKEVELERYQADWSLWKDKARWPNWRKLVK